MRSPLGKVKGLGSAKDGVGHWWGQRITALGLVPLLIWFVASICSLAGADYETVREWVSSPLVSILLILLTIATFHHAQLGLQVVLEDYVSDHSLKITGLVVVKFLAIGFSISMIFSVIKIALA